MNRKQQLLLLAIGAFLILCGCKRDYTHAEATASVNGTGQSAPEDWTAGVKDTGQVRDGWIKNFHDIELDSLVDEAMKNNPNLQAAAARVDRANALAKQAGAALSPTVDLGGQLAGGSGQPSASAQGVGLGISWEADVWGRLGLTEKSAETSARAVAADYEFARQSLAASTARGWFLLCETNRQIEFLKSIVGMLENMYRIEQKKQETGKVTAMEVSQVHASLAEAKDAVVKAEAARQESARSLETLIGRYPADNMTGADTLAATPPPIPVGQPSAILERRPDIIAAEDRVAAAFYAEKGAELLHLPRFTIQAGTGINALGDAIAGLTAGLFAPLYTGGEIEGQIEQATAEQKEAVANYAAAALKAFKEVETALTNEDLLKKREELLTSAVEDNRKTYELSKLQYDVGKIDMFEVLSHQAAWTGSEISLLNVKRRRLDNRISLHLALGGSFEEAK
ncbi:TolC family protein [Maridesulfovibrio sp.]|uniref:TolC family protein n=1 Tax=Maridesulfovibrio sp. TaxID=2795000 RepID=UPI002A18C571|nr:TolC family protein [Maridesulfovibrio sp.]